MISELSKLYGLTPRAIRFYEERGLVETSRDRLNCRRFDARARDRLRLIADLRRAGLTLGDIEEILDLEERGSDVQIDAALTKLEARRVQIDQMRTDVDAVAARLAGAGRRPTAAVTPLRGLSAVPAAARRAS